MLSTLATGGEGNPAAPAANGAFLGEFIRETRIVYPQQVDGWEAHDIHVYPDLRLGASIRYLHPREPGWIDLIVYPMGTISGEEAERHAAAEHEGLLAARPGARLGKLRRMPIRVTSGDGERDFDGWSTDLAFTVGDQRLHSAMTLYRDSLHLVKIRYSAEAEARTRRRLRTSLEAFTADAAAALVIRSTGACWNPPPVVPLAAADADPVDAALIASVEDQPTHFLLRDRVLARAPAEPGAEALQYLALAMANVLPGCVGREPVDVEAREGEGMIRIDYGARLPDTGASPSATEEAAGQPAGSPSTPSAGIPVAVR